MILGTFITAREKKQLETADRGYLQAGRETIEGVYSSSSPNMRMAEITDQEIRLIIPGLTDLHVHAPQHEPSGVWGWIWSWIG